MCQERRACLLNAQEVLTRFEWVQTSLTDDKKTFIPLYTYLIFLSKQEYKRKIDISMPRKISEHQNGAGYPERADGGHRSPPLLRAQYFQVHAAFIFAQG